MKLKKKKEESSININRPGLNQSKKWVTLMVILALAVGAIYWVNELGRKAEETIPVVMLVQDVYKNTQITEKMLVQYNMLIAEYEKYAIVNDNGTTKKRIVLWEDRGKLVGTFAAYPMQGNTVALYRSFIKSRIDNSDSVMYSFPGKDIIRLDMDTSALNSFKAFLQPGDRLNISAIYTDSFTEEKIDEYGSKTKETYDIVKTESVFNQIIVADLLNANGDSVLDLYAAYADLPTTKQAQLDKDASYQDLIQATTLLIALTPEEQERYNYFKAKTGIKFQVSLPQRAG